MRCVLATAVFYDDGSADDDDISVITIIILKQLIFIKHLLGSGSKDLMHVYAPLIVTLSSTSDITCHLFLQGET